MKKRLPLPLIIDCSGITPKTAAELANRLTPYFDTVELFADTIRAIKPVNAYRYGLAWRLLDYFNVKVY